MLDHEQLVRPLQQRRRSASSSSSRRSARDPRRRRPARCRRRACRARAGCGSRAGRARGCARRRARRSRRPRAARRRGARTRPCAHGQAFMPVASTPTSRRTPRSEAAATPISETICCVARPVTGVVRSHRVARRDPHLGAHALLPRGDLARDVLGQLLDEQRLADHDLVDRLLEQLREARHVHALLRRLEVDRAVDPCRDQLLGCSLRVADPDRLLDAAHPGARQAEAHLGQRGLEVVGEEVVGGRLI